MGNIKEKVIVITGASSGIGEATAISLAKRGAVVVLAARRIERLHAIAKKIMDFGGKVEVHKVDITIREEVENLAKSTKNRFGKLDVWINNAGIMPSSFLDKRKVHEWDHMIDVNMKGVLYGIAAVIPIMKEQQRGHIINVSSVAGHTVGLGNAVYSGTKFAVRAITEGLRLELSAEANIRTTIISPGSVMTELRNTITDNDMLEILESRQIRKRLRPDDIANSIIYAINQPEHVAVNEIIVRPTEQK